MPGELEGVSPRGRSRRGADETAPGFHGGAALTTLRAIFGGIAGDRQIEQRLGLHGKLDLAATAIDQCTRGDDPPARFFDNLYRFECGTSGGPDVFHHEYMLIRAQAETAAQRHRTTGVALDENRGNAAAHRLRLHL